MRISQEMDPPPPSFPCLQELGDNEACNGSGPPGEAEGVERRAAGFRLLPDDGDEMALDGSGNESSSEEESDEEEETLRHDAHFTTLIRSQYEQLLAENPNDARIRRRYEEFLRANGEDQGRSKRRRFDQ